MFQIKWISYIFRRFDLIRSVFNAILLSYNESIKYKFSSEKELHWFFSSMYLIFGCGYIHHNNSPFSHHHIYLIADSMYYIYLLHLYKYISHQSFTIKCFCHICLNFHDHFIRLIFEGNIVSKLNRKRRHCFVLYFWAFKIL